MEMEVPISKAMSHSSRNLSFTASLEEHTHIKDTQQLEILT